MIRVTFTIAVEHVSDTARIEDFDELAAALLDTLEYEWPDVPMRSWPDKCVVEFDLEPVSA